MRGLRLLGLNHATAPLEVRERVAFSRSQRNDALRALRRRYPSAEAVILSTCNRVELYMASNGDGPPTLEQVSAFLAEFHHVEPALLNGRSYRHADRSAIEHLFRVAASLDSMVVGENQILGQVRDAYDAARELGTTGRALNPLFQRAIAAGKQVMRHTNIGQGRLSLASVAVDCAQRIFDHFHDKTIVSVGAGKMATLMLKNLHELNPRQLRIVNRDPAKAAILADRFGATAVPFETLSEQLVEADIILTSTGSAHPIITRRQFEPLVKKRRYRPLFLIDIALPRDVEPGVGELENIYLYNIDDLQQVVGQTMDQRREAIASAQGILQRQIEEFAQWELARSQGPLIDQLFAHCHQMAKEELARTLRRMPDLSPGQQAEMSELARRLVNKLLHEPVRAIRNGARPGAHVDPAVYRHALQELFALHGKSGGSGGSGDEEAHE